MSWDAYVHLAFDEIRLAGANSPQVSRRLVAALDDLLEVAPAERRPVLADQLRLLTDAVRQSDRDVADREMATEPDGQGIGVAVNGSTPRQVLTRRVADAAGDGVGLTADGPLGRIARSVDAVD